MTPRIARTRTARRPYNDASPVAQRRPRAALSRQEGSASRFSASDPRRRLSDGSVDAAAALRPPFAAFTSAPTWASSTLPFDTTSSPYFNACLAAGQVVHGGVFGASAATRPRRTTLL